MFDVLGLGLGLGSDCTLQETEYEVTLDDLEWLKRYESGKVTEHVVDDFNEEGLERMLDLMEKATARNFPISQVRKINDQRAGCCWDVITVVVLG